MKVRISRLHHPVTSLGPGTRAGVWFQGCGIGCEGCMSRDTWSPDGGFELDTSEVLAWLSSLRDRCDGVTISGGEPFDQSEPLGGLLEGISSFRSGQSFDVLCYSGYGYRRLRRLHANLLERIDALVAGPYVRDRPTDLIWRGSANQEIVMLSELGRRRYTEFVDLTPSNTPIQVSVDADSVRYVGVPRRGDMERLETRLGELGVDLGASSWQA